MICKPNSKNQHQKRLNWTWNNSLFIQKQLSLYPFSGFKILGLCPVSGSKLLVRPQIPSISDSLSAENLKGDRFFREVFDGWKLSKPLSFSDCSASLSTLFLSFFELLMSAPNQWRLSCFYRKEFPSFQPVRLSFKTELPPCSLFCFSTHKLKKGNPPIRFPWQPSSLILKVVYLLLN